MPSDPVALSRPPAPLIASERPQERLGRCGAGALSDAELLALLLRHGTRGHDVAALAGNLLAQAGSLADLMRWSQADFHRLHGIGPVKATQLLAVLELARRLLSQPGTPAPELASPEQIFSHLRPVAAGLEVEKFWVLCLNRRHRLLRRVEVTSGTATAALAHPREVLREALRAAATTIVCAHNHPSGDPAPSAADVQVTRLLRDSARTVDIPLVDHVIVGRPGCDPLGRGWFSFRAAGLL